MKSTIRNGCRDVWNAFMADGAHFDSCDIPYCPTTAKNIPESIITWTRAVEIYRKNIRGCNYDFHESSYICFYIDDYKFDGTRGIWRNWEKALEIFRHFDGIITPDFSTYQDFPDPIKRYATYRMRLMGYWAGQNGISVINNVRWGTDESWQYSFSGIPRKSIVAIGTVGGSPRKNIDRSRFEQGFKKLIEILEPEIIIVYGSDNYDCFKEAKVYGIKIICYKSHTATAFERMNVHE